MEVGDTPIGRDAIAFRLTLNTGDVAAAWETMRRALKRILSAPDLLGSWWGYTVIYQAVLKIEVEASQGVLSARAGEAGTVVLQ